ncbi:MAG: hemolysin III family protein [Kiritimatiellaeota bacterium]|nr:hemolysin III family protein [Kiritimatiellota bacterium]
MDAQQHDSPEEREQTIAEEVVNAITHGVGMLLALGAYGVLVGFAAVRESAYLIVSAALYGMMMFAMYMSSTLYHAAMHARLKAALNVVDHNAIYLMIAGTYTPFCLGALREYSAGWGWSIFGVIWGLATVGIICESCSAPWFRKVSTAMYVLMGWVVIIAVYPMYKALGLWGLFWVVIGGIFYTLGVVFYLWKSLPFAHAVWHLCILAGSLAHFFAILFYVILS